MCLVLTSKHNSLTTRIRTSNLCILLISQFYFKFISVPMLFSIILLISFIIFRLLFKKPDDEFHRIA